MLQSLLLAALACRAFATPCHAPEHWLYSSDLDNKTLDLLDRPDIAGVQLLYSWRSLESAKDDYAEGFQLLQGDLDKVQAKGKKVWIQIQDRTFDPARDAVPRYMKTPEYRNGSSPQGEADARGVFEPQGHVAAHWVPAVRKRFQSLLDALGKKFDGKIHGINLPETAIDVTPSSPQNHGFTFEAYFDAALENAKHASSVFRKTFAVQYVNYWPGANGNDDIVAARKYFTRSFEFYARNHIGVGGPDLVPENAQGHPPYAGAMKNSYPFIHDYGKRVPISVMSAQEPDFCLTNGQNGTRFKKDDFVKIGAYLHARIIFWATMAPWLNGADVPYTGDFCKP
ncbi:uncharacterized protein UV8b_03835 [Ustilaginoidea virens]|uniref:Glycoside hydrolase family 42 N-terminal domain-containing protein n=1 Tax=Ustilaginoidea virens TaxID=1159556 RepID=A0A063C5N8_USTVR|nr:uncharacterized protein UV8b_03835 [Ustilaginoidea virens]QUC19594.1 hypothetical protein UV8b_03835 [Ustilaginoidea virens]GAO17254.1 hypothetical protein UVI_02061000 [Ustilaginoidea virens]